jgi:hypothetical protein
VLLLLASPVFFFIETSVLNTAIVLIGSFLQHSIGGEEINFQSSSFPFTFQKENQTVSPFSQRIMEHIDQVMNKAKVYV